MTDPAIDRFDGSQDDFGPYVVPEDRGPMGRVVPRLAEDDAPLGARIYLDGIGEDGRPVPRTAIGPGMMGGGCVTCHGVDGRGGRFTTMMWEFDAPDIRYDALVADHDHGDDGPWSDADILKAITDGETPDGETLDALMPRWDLTAEEFDALVEYLKELSEA
jgi:cytochrome c oxidase subunit 2